MRFVVKQLIHQHYTDEVKYTKNIYAKRFKVLRYNFYKSFFRYCSKHSIDPLSISINESYSFFLNTIKNWNGTTPYNLAHSLQYLYSYLFYERFNIINPSIVENVNTTVAMVCMKRDEIKRYKYQSMITESEALDFFRKLRLNRSRLVFQCYKHGLVINDLLDMKVKDIRLDLNCFTAKLKIYPFSIYKERIKPYRLLSYDYYTKGLIEKQLLKIGVDIKCLDEYAYTPVFEGMNRAKLLKEFHQIAPDYGFITGVRFLGEFRKLMITRLHRKNAPISVIMDFMNISKYSVYVSELQKSYLNKVDTNIIARSLMETFDLSN